jgi:hypothetical protein
MKLGKKTSYLYCATPAVTRDLSFSGLIRKTAPFSRLLRHTGGCGGSILTWILTATKIHSLLCLEFSTTVFSVLFFFLFVTNFDFHILDILQYADFHFFLNFAFFFGDGWVLIFLLKFIQALPTHP